MNVVDGGRSSPADGNRLLERHPHVGNPLKLLDRKVELRARATILESRFAGPLPWVRAGFCLSCTASASLGLGLWPRPASRTSYRKEQIWGTRLRVAREADSCAARDAWPSGCRLRAR